MLRDTLSIAGLQDETTIMFLSDHGEMLGERGLWYKMSYFEGACRIPLIVTAPGVFESGVVTQSVSQVDILPTLCSLASAPLPEETDGRSLHAHLLGEVGHDEVVGEYCAEGAIAPIVMIRRGRWKFIHSPADPDQLFDLQDDPDELCNLAGSAHPPAEYAAFLVEARQRWDFEALYKDVVTSQKRRSLLAEAFRRGHRTSWDYAPPSKAESSYIRSHKPLDTLELHARLPSRTGSKT
jgi:choline-sulfatase